MPPQLMRPWVMQACYSTASCHLGTTRTQQMHGRLYWWIGMNIGCTWWRLRSCLKCQARKTSRPTVRWPIISILLPGGPGIAVCVDRFGRLLVAPRGNTSILLFTGPTCSKSLQQSSQQRARPTFSSTCIFPSGDSRAALSLTTASRFLLKAFARRLEAFLGSESCHELLPSKRQSWSGASEPHDGANAGIGRQRAPRSLGRASPSRQIRAHPYGSTLGTKLLYLDLPSDMPGADARRCVSVQCCKPCANPHNRGNMPKYLPAG